MAMTSKQRRAKRASLKAVQVEAERAKAKEQLKADAAAFEPAEAELWVNKPAKNDRPLPRYEAMISSDASCFKPNKPACRNHKPLAPSLTVTGRDQKGYIQKSLSFHDYMANSDKLIK